MAEPLRVAVIGAGIGAEHVAALLQMSDDFEVAVICDLDEARAQALAKTARGARVETDLDDVLSDETIDLVDICLPPHLHLSAMVAALTAGKAVVCEKPLVASLAEMDVLEEAAASANRPVFPVFQYRFGPGFEKLHALMEAGLAGRPLVAALETHWHRDAAYYAVPWRGTWAGERGGALLSHAIHIHDLLTMVFGPVSSVHAALATRVNDIETEDCAALSIIHESGALATSSVTLGAATDTSRLRFCFEGLTAESGVSPYTPALDDWTFTARAPRVQSEVEKVLRGVDPAPQGYLGLFGEIAKALSGQDNRAVTMEDARASLGFVTAAYASSRSGRPEALPVEKTHPLYGDWTPR